MKSLQSIESARVPVIKVSSKEEEIPTDITFDLQGMTNTPAICTPQGTLAHHEGQASIQLLLKFKNDIPGKLLTFKGIEVCRLDTTGFDIETAAARKRFKLHLHRRIKVMNETKTCEVNYCSSYCLVLMVISFLQLFGNNGTRKKNLGVLLLDFLEYFGKKFDFQTMGISINGNGYNTFRDSFFNRTQDVILLLGTEPIHSRLARQLW